MKKLGILIIIGLFSMITIRAQESKNFTKQFQILEKAPLSDVMGKLKTTDDYVYESIYLSKLPLDEFEVNVGIKMPLAFVYAVYKGSHSREKFDTILAQLKTLPYDFEPKTDNKFYDKAVEIKSKSTGKKVADMSLDNFGALMIDFENKVFINK